MKTAGIIAEFNPFHNGHKFLIDSVKKVTDADHIVILCSGNFVQRGLPAVFDKTERAKTAILNGADVVFELPCCYSTASAETFATASVCFFHKLECIDYLCFGCETSNTDLLKKIANVLFIEPDSYKKTLSECLKKGITFPAARAFSLKNYFQNISAIFNEKEFDEIVSSANNILAIEYLKALKKFHSSIQPVFIKRVGAGYNDAGFNYKFASATGIRKKLSENNSADIFSFVPENSYDLIKDNKCIYLKDFSQILGYKLLNKENFEQYYDVSLFLSNRINHLKYNFTDYENFISDLQSKNYTYSGISRCLCHILLGITEEDISYFSENGYIKYGRLLGFRKGTNILSKIKEKSQIDIISKFSDYYDHCDAYSKKMLDLNIKADLLYRMIYMNKFQAELPTEFERQLFII